MGTEPGKTDLGANLDLDMNWDDSPPHIIQELRQGKTQFVKSYSIALSFDFKNDLKEGLKKFAKKSFKHSHVEGDTENLPVRGFDRRNPHDDNQLKNSNKEYRLLLDRR